MSNPRHDHRMGAPYGCPDPDHLPKAARPLVEALTAASARWQQANEAARAARAAVDAEPLRYAGALRDAARGTTDPADVVNREPELSADAKRAADLADAAQVEAQRCWLELRQWLIDHHGDAMAVVEAPAVAADQRVTEARQALAAAQEEARHASAPLAWMIRVTGPADPQIRVGLSRAVPHGPVPADAPLAELRAREAERQRQADDANRRATERRERLAEAKRANPTVTEEMRRGVVIR